MHTAHDPVTEFTLDESRLPDVAARYPIETDHDALLALETVIRGDRAGGPLLKRPCGIAVDLLTNADGEIDGYRIILRPEGDADAPGLASGIQRASHHRAAGRDTTGIITDFTRVANSLLARHQGHEAARRAAADGILLTGPQLRAWTGRDLTAADLSCLAMCIPASTIPGQLGAIVSQAMRLPAGDGAQQGIRATAEEGS